MDRKPILFCGILTLLAGTTCWACLRQSSSLLGIPLVSVQEEEDICQSRTIAPEDFPPAALTFQDLPVPYDPAAQTFYLPVSSQAEWDSGSLCLPGDSPWSQVLLVKDDSFTDDKLAMAKDGKTYQLLFYNHQYCQACQLVLTTLPVMSIDVVQGVYADDPNEPIGDTDSLAHIALYQPPQAQGEKAVLTESDALLKIHGRFARSLPKKSYSLSLVTEGDGLQSNDLSLLGMRRDDDWILNGLFLDSTKIREKLCMEIWDIIDGHTTYHSSLSMEYVEVILNGQYWGLYGLTYPVDAKGLDLEWNSERHDILYKTTDGIKPLLEEIDSAIAENLSSVSSVEIKYPKVKDYSQLWKPFWNMMAVVLNWDGEQYRENIVYYVDTESTVDYWLFFQFAYLSDATWNNLYFAARDTGNGHKIYVVPWDFDCSLGINYSSNAPWGHSEGSQTDIILDFTMAHKTLDSNTEDSVNMAVENWDNARGGLLTEEYLFGRIDALRGQLSDSGAYLRESNRWPEGLHMEGTQNIEYMEWFIRERLDFLDTFLHTPGTEKYW